MKTEKTMLSDIALLNGYVVSCRKSRNGYTVHFSVGKAGGDCVFIRWVGHLFKEMCTEGHLNVGAMLVQPINDATIFALTKGAATAVMSRVNKQGDFHWGITDKSVTRGTVAERVRVAASHLSGGTHGCH